jgi:hypothetical protein
VRLTDQRIAIIDLKGCLDGNNTNIFERPTDADEFVVWSLCTNPGADPRRNAWSGIHTRLGAEMMSRNQRVDGLVVWDMVCGTIGRPCPKVQSGPTRLTDVGPFRVPPACIYVFPATLPTVGIPLAAAQPLANVGLLDAFHRCFGGRDEEVNYVDFYAETIGGEINRRTVVRRAGMVQKASDSTPIRRA